MHVWICVLKNTFNLNMLFLPLHADCQEVHSGKKHGSPPPRPVILCFSKATMLQLTNNSTRGRKKKLQNRLIQNAVMNWTLIKMKGGCVLSGFIILNHLLNGFFFPLEDTKLWPSEPTAITNRQQITRFFHICFPASCVSLDSLCFI